MPMNWNTDTDAKVSLIYGNSHLPTDILHNKAPAGYPDATSLRGRQAEYSRTGGVYGTGYVFYPTIFPSHFVESSLKQQWLGCTPCAIDNRIVRLRRQVEGLSGTPVAGHTPRKAKRKDAQSEPKTPTKKGKATDSTQDSEWPEVDVQVLVVKLEAKKEANKEDKKERVQNQDAWMPQGIKLEKVVDLVDME